MSDPVNVDIQVLPSTGGDVYAIVDRAIGVIQASGLKYEVGALGTTVEGDLETCLDVAKKAHRACFVDGVAGVVTIIKIGEAVGGSTIEEKVSKFRGDG
ncbi:MAG: thiamine-binding protein [Caldilineaceae bacterium]|nr:thiamine-binding protein [Caldilineaceae bacterium]MDE0462772.1 thiamine-binding protein [Caldilineaceae bacterium]MXX25894.1 thiamine-binding protein [Caldilineaceae bacterium SB0668_bin_21]MYC20716.1 thiamine-binding protein [Caldilineaceae bacterium SB0662_bin_25]